MLLSATFVFTTETAISDVQLSICPEQCDAPHKNVSIYFQVNFTYLCCADAPFIQLSSQLFIFLYMLCIQPNRMRSTSKSIKAPLSLATYDFSVNNNKTVHDSWVTMYYLLQDSWAEINYNHITKSKNLPDHWQNVQPASQTLSRL